MEGWLSGDPNAAQAPKTKKKAAEERREFLPWIEKYRPKKVEELAYQDEVVAVLKKCLEGADLPNLLFYGPPGTGKTSAILAMARQLFGGEYYRSRVLELNASDERGIQVIRDKVKSFASGTAPSRLPDGRACLPLRLVILDEADSMTTAAQAALRRTMERMSKYTRFCLICNYVSRIIDPITSRCAKFRFKPLSPDTQRAKLEEIALAESVDVSSEALAALISGSEGDLRRSITYLQAAQRLVGPGGSVGLAELEPITGLVPDDCLSAFVAAAASASFEQLTAAVDAIISEGWPAAQIISQLVDVVTSEGRLEETSKAAVLHRIGVVEMRLLSGADEWLQLMDLGSVLAKHYVGLL